MKFILGTKKGMTRKFMEDGKVIPVTMIEAGPCYITQIKDKTKDGYTAVQVGYQEAKKINKPLTGHLKASQKLKNLKEFRIEQDQLDLKTGQQISVAVFEKGDKVKVSADSKGKGFQGVVKRHGFSGGPKSHGHKDQLRMPGSIGATGPARVFKGVKMAGRMGGKRVSIANLEIIDLDPKKNILYIKGAVPGRFNSLVEVIAPGEMDLTKVVEPKKKEKKQDDQKKNSEVKKDKKSESKEDDKDAPAKKEETKKEETVTEKDNK